MGFSSDMEDTGQQQLLRDDVYGRDVQYVYVGRRLMITHPRRYVQDFSVCMHSELLITAIVALMGALIGPHMKTATL